MKFASIAAVAIAVFAAGCATTPPSTPAARGIAPLSKAQVEQLNPEIKIYSSCLIGKTRDYAAGTSDVRLIVDTVVQSCRQALLPLNEGMEKMQLSRDERQFHLAVFERSGANAITDLLLKARARAAQPQPGDDKSDKAI